ncbi:MAG: hypothetical protein D6785_15825 [Planctomycetota bacterium]|nr:MAG: hypothetical protein D6785_15825 [Planctomycetota bacterium]
MNTFSVIPFQSQLQKKDFLIFPHTRGLFLYFLWIALLLIVGGCNRPYLFYDPPYRAQKRPGMAITPEKVMDATKAGVSEDILILQIQKYGISRRLTQKDMEKLKKSGVSPKVIDTMKKFQPKIKKRKKYRYYYYYYPRSTYYYRSSIYYDYSDGCWQPRFSFGYSYGNYCSPRYGWRFHCWNSYGGCR